MIQLLHRLAVATCLAFGLSIASAAGAPQATPQPSQATGAWPLEHLIQDQMPGQGRPKRETVHLTAVDDDGQAYSYDHGPIHMHKHVKLLLASAGLLTVLAASYLLWAPASLRSAPSGFKGDPAPASHETQSALSGAPPQELLLQEAPSMASPAPSGDPFSLLVHACGGNLSDAAAAVAEEARVDPDLPANSPLLVQRALRRKSLVGA